MRLRSRIALITLTCAVAGGALSGASAMAPGTGHRAAAKPKTEAAEVGPVTKPAAPAMSTNHWPKGPPGFTLAGIVIDTTTQAVKKAKIVFNLPELTSLSYTHAVPEVPVDPTYQWDDSTTYAYVTSPAGTKPEFGVFPTTKVHMLAFGTVPVTAKVHIEQIKRNGKLVPLKVLDRFSGTTIPQSNLPCGVVCQLSDTPHLTGFVNVRIDSLEVDEVPVDVGANCHTATPAALALTANRGYFSVSPPFTEPGVYIPYVGGTLHGPVNVPAFTGCRNGNDDLSPLVTGMVSGPGNELTIHQKGGLTRYPPPKSAL